MKTSVQSNLLEYGDALFDFLKIALSAQDDKNYTSVHCHQFYELHFCLRGSYTYTVNHCAVTLSKNQLLIIPPMTPHMAVYNEGEDYEYDCLSLNLSKKEGESGFFKYFKDVLNKHSNVPISLTPHFIEKGHQLRGFINSPHFIKNVCAIKMLESEFIYRLFDALDGFESSCPILPRTGDVDRSVLLEELVNKPSLSLGEIAAELGYSVRHTARIIKNTYGCPISELRKKNSIEATGEQRS